jgi:hypothetical protein
MMSTELAALQDSLAVFLYGLGEMSRVVLKKSP